MSNGIVNVTLSTPYGFVTSISYGGVNNLLATQNVEKDRGYITYKHLTPSVSNLFGLIYDIFQVLGYFLESYNV